MLFNKLFQKRNRSAPAANLAYEKIVAQARHPGFYLSGRVDDTVDGRFDMIVLHAYLLINRLNEDGDGRSSGFAQAVFDVLFEDMDRSLREMGVGDISVGKKVKMMAQVFYGRAKAYEAALKVYEQTPDELIAVLERNLFPDREETGAATRIAAYMVGSRDHLRDLGTADLLAGECSFADPEVYL